MLDEEYNIRIKFSPEHNLQTLKNFVTVKKKPIHPVDIFH